MKFTSDRKNMYEILKPLLRIAKRNAVIKELECVFLNADENDGFLYSNPPLKNNAIIKSKPNE